MSRARDEIMELARSFSLTTEFSDAVMVEVQRCLAEPGLDDPALVDATERPFVTIDNEDSRDLDQALFIEARGEGHVVHYALADASYYVRPGSRLYAEALVRGASFYLPGFVAPMLPVELSEGLVSLNPEVERRAVVFLVELDGRGEVVSIRIERQRIRSRAKLSYVGVQRFWDSPTSNHLENRDFTSSLWALRDVGRRRVALAEAGGVVHYPRIEVDIGFTDSEGRRFHVFESHRTECDRANEQLSLLVNVEGARLLERHVRDTGDPNIAAVYRVHPAPEARPRRSGTVMGVAKDRLFVLLDAPPLDLKVYARDLGAAVQHVDDTLIVDGVTFALGDRIEVRAEHFDPQRDRFALSATLGTAAEGDTMTLRDVRP